MTDSKHISKILVVDDTAVYRRILSDVVGELDNAELAGTAPNGNIALKKVEALQPDLVLLDLEMPELDGLETLKIIRRKWPEIGVIVISGVNSAGADKTIKALQAGALDFIPKPTGTGTEEGIKVLRKKIGPLLTLFTTRRFTSAVIAATTRPPQPTAAPAPPRPQPPKRAIAPVPSRFRMLAIGSSTGGPEALGQIIPHLPADLGVPILLVQHMPPVFTASLAENLNRRSALTVKEAQNGEWVFPDVVYIAPGGRHMVLRRSDDNEGYVIGINDNPPVKSCRPSVDVLFRSIAVHHGGGVLAVMLTGMGDDGADGVGALKREGCRCLSQTEKTCVVYGMPRAIDEAGYADESIDLPDIAARIKALFNK